MEKLFEQFCTFLKEKSIQFTQEENTCSIYTPCNGFLLQLRFNFQHDIFESYANFPFYTKEEFRPEMASFILELNYYSRFLTTEMDLRDGELRLRYNILIDKFFPLKKVEAFFDAVIGMHIGYANKCVPFLLDLSQGRRPLKEVLSDYRKTLEIG